MRYKYCPECGEKLIEKLAGDDGLVPFCESCSKYWFDTFANCSIILVANDEKEIALLSQNYLSDRYKTLVSGYIASGETPEETALREVEEELGIVLDSIEYVGAYWFAKRELLMHGFIGYTKKKEFVLSKEVDAAEWVPALEIVDKIFPDSPGNAVYPLYRRYLEENQLE